MTVVSSNMNSITVADTEIVLSRGDLRLKISPYGASLRGLWRETPSGEREEIIAGYTGAKGKVGGQGDVLIPFPGRIRDGKYTFDGESYQMEINDKEGPNAIHGFLRQVVWDIQERTESRIVFAVSLDPEANPGYPFAVRSTVAYSLEEDGMACRFTLQNAGDRRAPAAAGFHPYFTVGSPTIDVDDLHIPMESILEVKDLLPTGRILPVAGTTFDFLTPRAIGGTVFNICYLQPKRDESGLLNIRLVAPGKARALTVWLDEAFDYVVVYSGDPLPEEHRRRSLAIEPMTCGIDAFNRPDWNLSILAPGESLSGSWGVTAR